MPADFSCSQLLDLVKQLELLSLGIFHPAFAPIEHVRQRLQDILPANIHILASQRLGVSLTRWPDGHNVVVTDFASRDEVIQVSSCRAPGPGGR